MSVHNITAAQNPVVTNYSELMSQIFKQCQDQKELRYTGFDFQNGVNIFNGNPNPMPDGATPYPAVGGGALNYSECASQRLAGWLDTRCYNRAGIQGGTSYVQSQTTGVTAVVNNP